MKPLRTAIVLALALALATFGLTGCSDSDDCEDDAAARPASVRYEPAAFDVGVKPPPPAPKPAPAPAKPAQPKTAPTVPTIHTAHDCGDDD